MPTISIIAALNLHKKMKRILAALMLLSSLTVQAQSNYRAAEITDSLGHVQAGYINYREWDNNPTQIDFKISLDDKKPVVYSPSMLRSFVINGFEKFSAYRVSISLNETNLINLPSAIDSASKTDNVFLKQVTTGSRLTLYSYTDLVKTRLYIQEGMAPPTELLYQEYYGSDRQEIKHVNTYLRQLNAFIIKYSNNESFLNLLTKIKYKKNDIENLVNEINGIKPQKKSGFNGRFFLSAALNLSTTKVSGENIFSSAPSSSTYTPKISFGMDIFMNPEIQKVIFRTDVSLSYIDPKMEKKDASLSFRQYTATITPQLIINVFNKDDVKVYLDAGVGFNISQYTNKAYASVFYYSNGFPYNMSSFWLNLPVQAGVVLNKRVELFTSYSSTTGYTQHGGFSIGTSAVNVGARLLLKSKKK